MPAAKSLPKWAESFDRTLSHRVSAKFMGGSAAGIAKGRDGGVQMTLRYWMQCLWSIWTPDVGRPWTA